MSRTIAFLRAINVGGHNVKMDQLRALFEEMGFANVETYIASGNVIFDTPSKPNDKLEQKIEAALEKALGYEVATFCRTDSELAAVATYAPFSEKELAEAKALNVAFLKAPLNEEQLAGLKQFHTDIDDFHTQGCELYWKCRLKQSDSTFNNARMERALKLKATFRGINTVRKMAANYAS